MNKVIKWIVVIFIAIIVLALIFGGREEQTSESAENTTDSTVNTDSTDVEQSESSDAEEGVSESTTDLLKAYEDNEIKDDRVQKEHAQSQWRGNDE